MSDTPNPIDAILARLKGSTQTSVNPSVAAQVLDTATRAEVANVPPPPAQAPTTTLPTVIVTGGGGCAAPAPAPAETADSAESKRTRRTAGVVQQELDAALIRIAELEARPTSPVAGPLTTEQLVDALRERGYKVLLEAE